MASLWHVPASLLLCFGSRSDSLSVLQHTSLDYFFPIHMNYDRIFFSVRKYVLDISKIFVRIILFP